MEEMNFSARAHDRILKFARTLADLSGSLDIRPNEILEAIQLRSLDRKLFTWLASMKISCANFEEGGNSPHLRRETS